MHTPEIAGASVPQLAERFGTPLYIYDRALIEQRAAELLDFGAAGAARPVTVRYAMKACSNRAVLTLLRRLGVVVDCVSIGEVSRALDAGFAPGRRPAEIVFTCDVFDRQSLPFVVERGIAVNAGSIDMIHQYGAAAAGGEITLRVNPGFGHGHSRKTNTGGSSSKHGIWHEDLGEALAAARRYGLRICGVHMHIGSGTDLTHLAKVCQAMKATVLQVGPEVEVISAGGGLPVPYRPEDRAIDLASYKRLWEQTRSELAAGLGHDLQLEIEPGRYLVAESGYLLTEIRAVKRMGENLFYLVDAGFNELARPVMYGAYHPITGCTRDGAVSERTVEAAVAGPLCESGDVFTQSEGGYLELRTLPQLAVGDFLLFHVAGAYGASMSSNYNSRPYCAEVLIDRGAPKLIRERQSVAELSASERVPDDL